MARLRGLMALMTFTLGLFTPVGLSGVLAADIDPPQAPLPTCRNLPFQPDCGSQTSARMSESLDGVSFSVTRQNGGTVVNAAAAAAFVEFGGANAPARTGSAERTCPLVTFTCASDSHAVGAAAAAGNVPSVVRPDRAINAAMLMRRSVDQRAGIDCVESASA